MRPGGWERRERERRVEHATARSTFGGASAFLRECRLSVVREAEALLGKAPERMVTLRFGSEVVTIALDDRWFDYGEMGRRILATGPEGRLP